MKSTKLTIGTDPELVLLDHNAKLVRAGDVINQEKDKFGVDGHPFIAELRPAPAIHPRDLVASIREVLGSRALQLQNLVWRAGPWICDKPLGGHIHFGVPKEDHIVDALNHQFAVLLALIEPSSGAKTRRTHVFYGDKPYGQLGDVRSKEWGFEYRTPSSFIEKPGVALGLLTAAKAIVWEEINGGSQAFSKLTSPERTALTFTEDDFHQCNKPIFLPKLENLKQQLEKMLYFKKGQEGSDLWSAVTYLLKQVVEKGGYSVENDIKEKWNLVPPRGKTKSGQPPTLWQSLAQPGNWWSNTTAQDNFVMHGIFAPLFTEPAIPFSVPPDSDPELIWQRLIII